MKNFHASTSAVNRFSWLQANVFKAEALSATARLVACVLVSFLNDKTLDCFPKVSTIASAAQLNERTVRNAINELIDCNLVKKNSHAIGFMKNRNTYQLLGISKPKADINAGAVPASASGTAPERDSGSYRNTDSNNTDRRKSHIPASQVQEHQLMEVVTKRWQQLSRDPWTNENARQHVGLAIERAGIDAVTDQLNEVSSRKQRFNRSAILDMLQAIGTTKAPARPSESIELLGKVTDVWAAIAQDFARHPLLDCPLPFTWLKQISARIANNQIELKPQTPLVRDQLRNRFEQLLSDCCRKHGLKMIVA
jgi:hypothetical protein|tara:strand:+ start:9256 stop:10185 length:930 start_codon:yes stop_codon:yes gene_type:complete